jgi:predicted transcriptional regulator
MQLQEGTMDKKTLLNFTSNIVASHTAANKLSRAELLAEIGQVFGKLASLAGVKDVEPPGLEELPFGKEQEIVAAVPLEAAFGADKIFCMVCGQGMKTLKRHLSTAHDLKPGEYRKRFGIRAGTPLVAKDYSEARRKMATDLNLAEGLAKARAARAKRK